MQLKIRRGQRAGMMGGSVVFTMDVLVDLTSDERALVERYKLWKETVYSSEPADANSARAHAGSLTSLGAVVLDRVLKRFFTIQNLVSGEHIECKDLAELLATEEQIRVACLNIKKYLAVAQSFDGREEVIEVSEAA